MKNMKMKGSCGSKCNPKMTRKKTKPGSDKPDVKKKPKY